MNTNILLKKSLLALSIVAALGLSGCDGDGNAEVIDDTTNNPGNVPGDQDQNANGGGDTTPVVSSTPTTFSGRAALVDHGYILAWELNPTTGEKLSQTPIASAITDADGNYSLALPNTYSNGPVLLELAARSDTTMICDVQTVCNDYYGDNVINYGKKVVMDPNAFIRAIIPAGEISENAINKANIWAGTHMAAARAYGMSEFDPAKANAEMEQLVGTGILSTNIIDVTKADEWRNATPQEQLLGAFLAGLSRIAMKNGRNINVVPEYHGDVNPDDVNHDEGVSVNIPEVSFGLMELAESFKDGMLTAHEHGIDPVSIQEFINDIEFEAEEAGLMPPNSIVKLQLDAIRAQIGLDGSWTASDDYNRDTALLEGEALANGKKFFYGFMDWMEKIRRAGRDLREWKNPERDNTPDGYIADRGYKHAFHVYQENYEALIMGELPVIRPAAAANFDHAYDANYLNIINHFLYFVRNQMTSADLSHVGDYFEYDLDITEDHQSNDDQVIGKVKIRIDVNDWDGLTFTFKDIEWKDTVAKTGVVGEDGPLNRFNGEPGTKRLHGLDLDLVIKTDIDRRLVDKLNRRDNGQPDLTQIEIEDVRMELNGSIALDEGYTSVMDDATTRLTFENFEAAYTYQDPVILDNSNRPIRMLKDILRGVLVNAVKVREGQYGDYEDYFGIEIHDTNIASATYRGNTTMRQSLYDNLLPDEHANVTYTYAGEVDVELVPLDGNDVGLREPEGYLDGEQFAASLKHAYMNGTLSDDKGNSISVNRKFDIENSNDFSTMPYMNELGLTQLVHPEAITFNPDEDMWRAANRGSVQLFRWGNDDDDSTRDLASGRKAPTGRIPSQYRRIGETPHYFMQGTFQLDRSMDIASSVGGVGSRLNADVHSVITRIDDEPGDSYRRADLAVEMNSDDLDFTITAELAREEDRNDNGKSQNDHGNWGFARTQSSNHGDDLPVGTLMTIDNGHGGVLTLWESEGTHLGDHSERKLQGDIVVNGVEVGTIVEVEDSCYGRVYDRDDDSDSDDGNDLTDADPLLKILWKDGMSTPPATLDELDDRLVPYYGLDSDNYLRCRQEDRRLLNGVPMTELWRFIYGTIYNSMR